MRPLPTDDQLTSARPIAPGSRDSTEKIHQHLRASILSGELPASIELSQARVAKDFQVSGGPVREAFRLLQREELIETQVNHRARVTGLSLSDVEHVYRAALTFVAAMDPTHEPALLRAAVRQVASPVAPAEQDGRQVKRR